MRDSPSSRPPLDRLMYIHDRLLEGASLNCTTLKEMFGLGRRTFLRDVAFLRDRWDMPVEFDETRQTYYYDGRVQRPPSGQVTEADLLNAQVALQAIETYREAPFYPQLASAMEKLTGALRDRISFTPQTDTAAVSFKHAGVAKTAPAVFKVLSRGALQEKEVRFFYRKPGDAEHTQRRVQPYHLSHRDNLWYLIAYDLDRRALRTFAVPRIAQPKLLTTAFKRPKDFSAEKYFASALNVMGGDGNYRIVLRFSGAAADRVSEREWHESQKLRRRAGRCIELTLQLGALGEVEGWVLTWGAQVEVIAPLELRERVRKTALDIARKNAAA